MGYYPGFHITSNRNERKTSQRIKPNGRSLTNL
jgi:hypothetical protein